jgi:hypothetical protein
MTRRFQERRRFAPGRIRSCAGQFDDDRALFDRLIQRCRYGDLEITAHHSAASGRGTQACKTQAEKIAKELHGPISS